MSEPVIIVPVATALERIEAKLDRVQADVHKLQLGAAAQGAVARARVAMWTAVVSAAGAGSALLVALTRH